MPETVTSSSVPSSMRDSGAILIPPPKMPELHRVRIVASTSIRSPPSISSQNGNGAKERSSRIVAAVYRIVCPALEPLARR